MPLLPSLEFVEHPEIKTNAHSAAIISATNAKLLNGLTDERSTLFNTCLFTGLSNDLMSVPLTISTREVFQLLTKLIIQKRFTLIGLRCLQDLLENEVVKKQKGNQLPYFPTHPPAMLIIKLRLNRPINLPIPSQN